MNEAQAKERCRVLAETSPDRETHSWLPRSGPDGEWSVVKLGVPPAAEPEATASKSPESKGIRDDPRNALEQNIPPHGIGF